MENIKELANKMTHTCYRCGNSYFDGKGLHCECGKHMHNDINAETTCKWWQPSTAVQSVIDGYADAGIRRAVIEIMNARVAKGIF